jgi:hypothetical protein
MTVNPLVDELEELMSCYTDAERAAWLLTTRMPVLSKYEGTIRNRLTLAGFQHGVEYLEGEVWRYRLPRSDGELTHLNRWRETMLEYAGGNTEISVPYT